MINTTINSDHVTSNCNIANHPLYTLGYTSFLSKDGKHSLDLFVRALQLFQIRAVVDVRSSPYGSAYFREYSKDTLQKFLSINNIYYLHFGKQFGARPENPNLFTDGRADFSKMSQTADFLDGCRRIVLSGLQKMGICLLCAEKDPLTCHRAILVANQIRINYPKINILHIQQGCGRGKDDVVPPGQNQSSEYIFAETQIHADQRLLQEELLTDNDMYQQLSFFNMQNVKHLTLKERICEAYLRREQKISWKNDGKQE